jgi:hypothetical protein
LDFNDGQTGHAYSNPYVNNLVDSSAADTGEFNPLQQPQDSFYDFGNCNSGSVISFSHGYNAVGDASMPGNWFVRSFMTLLSTSARTIWV